MKNRKMLCVFSLALALILAIGLALNASASSGSLSKSEIDAIVETTTDASAVVSPFTAAVKAVRDSVVLVRNYQVSRSTGISPFGWGFDYGYGFGYGDGYNGGNSGTERLAGTGSGSVISNYGHVLTNYHVVEDASRVTVFDGENEYAAEVVVSDEALDIAVLLCPELNLPAVALGDSDQLQEGEWAIVIGNPLGEDFFRSTTVGVVSSLERKVEASVTDKYGRKSTTENAMIQVDAAINSGNSGGGMFNVLGQLMGIPSLKYTSSYFSSTSIDNIGMCIPINVAKPLIREALEKYDAENVQNYLDEKSKAEDRNNTGTDLTDKPRLGESIRALDGNNTAVSRGVLPRGCIVLESEAGSPAEAAGIQVGDIIVEVDGTVITSTASLQQIIIAHDAGDTLQVKIYRAENNPLEAQYISEIGEGEYIDLEVTLQVIESPAA